MNKVDSMGGIMIGSLITFALVVIALLVGCFIQDKHQDLYLKVLFTAFFLHFAARLFT